MFSLIIALCLLGVLVQPLPDGVLTNDEVSVEVRTGLFRWKKVPAMMALTAVGTGNGYVLPDSLKAEFGGIAKVPKVTRCAVASAGSRRSVRFRVHFLGSREPQEARLSPGEKRIINPPGEYARCVVLEVHAPRTGYSTEGYGTRIVFEAGYHTVANDPRIVPDSLGHPVVRVGDDTAVILEEGAHVCASFDIRGSRHVRICGKGFINLLERCPGAENRFEGELWGAFRKGAVPAVYIHRGAADIRIEGIGIIADFRAVCGRCSEGISVKDVTMLTSAANGDGLSFINCRDVLVEDCLIHSQDDAFAVFNNCDSIRHLWDRDFEWPALSDGLTLRNCVLWTTCRPFCIGGHATGNTAPRDTVRNITVEHCKVSQAYNLNMGRDEKSLDRLTFWGGAFRILSQSGQVVKGLAFRDVEYDWVPGYIGQPFHLCVRDGSRTSYGEKGGFSIEDVVFEDIRFLHVPEFHLPPYLKEPAETEPGGGLHRIVFRNISFDGRVREIPGR